MPALTSEYRDLPISDADETAVVERKKARSSSFDGKVSEQGFFVLFLQEFLNPGEGLTFEKVSAH